MADLCELTATRLAELVRGGEISRREVVEAHLTQVERVNPSVNALVAMRAEAALAEADAGDSGGERTGGPLDGVPVSIKQNFDVAGMATTRGVPARRELVADRDEPAVARLRAAGAIVIGKANMPDHALRWNTVSSLHGTTRNPRDPRLTAGGSSGGDAAAVAAGMCPLGLGSDYGGSVRVPASWCGVPGLRVSVGLVPKAPVTPPLDPLPSYDLMASPGPIARSIEDLELALDVLAGPEPADPTTVPAAAPAGPAGEPPPVALAIASFGAPLEPEVEQAVRSTAEALGERGYRVEEPEAPDLGRASDLWREIVGTELMRFGMAALRDQLGPSGLHHAESVFGPAERGPDVARYLEAMVERRALAREIAAWMERYPLVLAPVTGMTAPPIEFDDMIPPEETAALLQRMRGVAWVNLLGLPAVALGNGAQVVARRFHDRDALAAARAALPGAVPLQLPQEVGGAQ
jgi:amidase